MTNSDKICCPKFDPSVWDEKEHKWENKSFIRETIPEFWHMPLPSMFGRSVKSMWDKIEKEDAKADPKDFLMLAADTSPWKGEIYINTTKNVPDADNVTLSGNFLTKVFDGPFNKIPQFVKEMDSYVGKKGKEVEKYYFYYPYCPKCAKKYGHNYIVTFAQVI
jgi:hypothetical protein